MNAAMAELVRDLGGLDESHGRPRNPQCQGLVENANKTFKRKLKQICMDNGFTDALQVFDWVPLLGPLLISENDAPIPLYGGVSAFVCLHGAPRSSSRCRRLSATAVEKLHTYMHECQETRAGKLRQYPELEDLSIGSVVRVRATDEEIKQHVVISRWSVRAVIHSVNPRSSDYFKLRWLTNGLSSAGRSRAPGALSHQSYGRHDLRLEKPVVSIPVYQSEHGHYIVVQNFSDGECNYVYIDGDFKGKEYSGSISECNASATVPYSTMFAPEDLSGMMRHVIIIYIMSLPNHQANVTIVVFYFHNDYDNKIL